MTAQIPDRLIHRGRTLDLCARLLDDYLMRLPKSRRPIFLPESTAHWRGYLGTWEFRDGRLLLTAVEGWFHLGGGEPREASLDACFPWLHGRPLHARWVTEELRCPEGRLRAYVHAGFASEYERDRIFVVRRGMLIEEWLVYNPPAPLHYQIQPDGARRYYAGPSARPEHEAPDPFPADAPVEPWRLWGDPDWDIEGPGESEDQGWQILAETRLG